MGVTIHYKGKFQSAQDIDVFCEEATDIAKSMGWDYSCFPDFDLNDKVPLKGIIIRPHTNSESLFFMADKNGFLRNLVALTFSDPADEITFAIFTKTQFAPVETHIAIVKLLKYFKKKYIPNLEVYDEGEYWETGDAKILEKKVEFLNSAIDFLETSLNSSEFESGSTPESIVEKIEEILRKMNFKK